MRTLIVLFLLLVLAVPASQAQYAFRIGDDSFDRSRGIATGAAGETFVTGSFNRSADFDPGPGEAILTADIFHTFVAAYDAGGSYRWAFQIGGDGSSSFGYDVAAAPEGDVMVGGSFSGFETDFDPDPDEEVILSSACGGGSAFVARYTTAGAYRWAFPLGGCLEDPVQPGLNQAWGVDATPDEGVLVTGIFRGQADFDPGPGEAPLSMAQGHAIFLASYDAEGTYRWAFQVGDTPDTGEGFAVASDAAGGAVVVGAVRWPADFDPDPGGEAVLTPIGLGLSDLFVARYDAEGGYEWAFNLGSAGEYTEAWDVALDAEGNVYVTGDFDGPTDFDPDPSSSHVLTPSTASGNGFIASYDVDGAYRWAFPYAGTTGSQGRALTLNSAGNLVVAGTLGGTADLDPDPDTEALFTGTNDGFLASYTTELEFRWAGVLEGPEPGEGAAMNGLAGLPAGRVAATGALYGTVDFDPGPGEHWLTSAGGSDSDIFVASYADGGGFPVHTEAAAPGEEVRLAVAPNPARGRAQVTVAVPSAQRVRVEAYDVLGRRVAVLHDGQAPAGPLRLGIEAGALAPGVYVVRAVGETFRAAQTVTRLR